MKRILYILLLITYVLTAAVAAVPDAYQLSTRSLPSVQSDSDAGVGRLLSNSIIDMRPDSSRWGIGFWLGTGNGLNFWKIADSSWLNVPSGQQIGQGGISAVIPYRDTVWAATAYDAHVAGSTYPAGGGIGFSADGGRNWYWQAQPVDSRDCTGFHPTTTNIQNITYDLAVTSRGVWAASFGGGLRVGRARRDTISVGGSTTYKDTLLWTNRPPDANPFGALAYLNHRAFSVHAVDDSILWVGTAGGINRSTDWGATWQNFSYSPADTQTISGNFVVAIHSQRLTSGNIRIWAATWKAEGASEEYGISWTDNSGVTWHRTLLGEKVHNITTVDTIVFAAGPNGLFKTIDNGTTWGLFDHIESNSQQRFVENSLYSVAYLYRRLAVGGPDGWAVSRDLGRSWSVGRSYISTSTPGQPSTYAYPNPYSPNRFGAVRFQYSLPYSGKVTLTLFNFAMEKAGVIVKSSDRPAGDNTEIWDGRFNQQTLANGVYFYRLEKPGGAAWGKLVILD